VKRRVFTARQSGSLVELVARAGSLAPGEAQALVLAGAVYVDGRRARRDGPVTPGALVAVVLEESGRSGSAPVAAPPSALAILYEDESVLAVDKPAGLAAQPTPGRGGDSLLDLASHHLARPAGLVHRLDRETSGVMVFGKTGEATRRLAAAFREGRARKAYLAIVAGGVPERGVIELGLSRDPSRPGRWRASPSGGGLPARTRYERRLDGPLALLALFPETGRTHQLRAPLRALGHPIVGDRLYGGPPGPRCLLHAHRLAIEDWTFTAPLPDDLVALLPAAAAAVAQGS
jgi:23S rRNA pseudouridine1911/1915/1917 synthase